MPEPQDDLVIGVAGHIDHGKTALVRALTGVDTDRLPEEKARGITIELGFAPLSLADGRRAAMIDMPGHERFVRTMIAGAGGIDAMLLVVAANEGVMPQTREHLAIAELMGVRAGVCALSKCDTTSEDIVALAVDEVRELLAGTSLEGVDVVPVSAHTGAGMDALRTALAGVAVSPRDASGPALLPVDRVFVRKGFGVVVTGTLLGGRVRVGDALAVGPLGFDHHQTPVRVRGLQVHGDTVFEARAGTRLAINLAGIELAELPRGVWLFEPAVVAVSRSFDAWLRVLPQTRRALGRRTRLELAAGATHALAAVSLLEGETLAPGAMSLVRVTTDRPVVLRPGDRMVLRGPPSLAGVGSTVGGLEVVRPEAERVRRRAVAFDRARRSAVGDVVARVGVELSAAGPKGLSRTTLQARTGYQGVPTEADGVVTVSEDRHVGVAVMASAEAAVLDALSGWHGKNPGDRGVVRRTLAALGDDALVDAALLRLVASGRVTRDGDVIARAGWKPRGMDDLPFLSEIRAALAQAGLSAPRLEEIAKLTGATAKHVEAGLKRLVERGDVVRINTELFVDGPAMASLEARLVEHLEAHGTLDAQGYKDLTGLSRKYVIPYAEYFDAKKVTLRIGDMRKLRGR